MSSAPLFVDGRTLVPADDAPHTEATDGPGPGVGPAAALSPGMPARRGRGWLVRRALLAGDIVALIASFSVAAALTADSALTGQASALVVLSIAVIPAWAVAARLFGLYDRDEERADHSTVDDLVGILNLVTLGTWLFVLGSAAEGRGQARLATAAVFWLSAVVLVATGRTLARAWCRARPAYVQRTIVVGAGDVGQLVARKIVKHPEYGLELVGFVDDHARARRPDLQSCELLGSPDQLADIVERLDVDRVVIAFSNDPDVQTMEAVRALRAASVQIDIVPRLFEVIGPRVEIHEVEGLPLVGLAPVRLSRSSFLLKRAIDLVGASVMLVLAAPLLALIAAKIKLDSPGPVLFRQTRLGINMREFTTLKFRTMAVDTDSSAHEAYIRATMDSPAEAERNGLYKLDRSDSITRFGRVLRKTSLDELPQLLNVLRGDMSLVGPRPCIPYETTSFAPHHFERFLVPQGITGLWQVTARANSTFGEALDMDVLYARGWSLGLDLRLLLRTPLRILRQRTATA